MIDLQKIEDRELRDATTFVRDHRLELEVNSLVILAQIGKKTDDDCFFIEGSKLKGPLHLTLGRWRVSDDPDWSHGIQLQITQPWALASERIYALAATVSALLFVEGYHSIAVGMVGSDGCGVAFHQEGLEDVKFVDLRIMPQIGVN